MADIIPWINLKTLLEPLKSLTKSQVWRKRTMTRPIKVAVQNKYEFITKDGYLFNNPQSDIGHHLLKGWNDLKRVGEERGILFFTLDQIQKEEVDVAIFMNELEKWSLDKQASAMMLEVGITNTSAIALYEKLGYKTIATRRNYYGPGLDAFVMRKEFGA